jgi:hypothetical protein
MISTKDTRLIVEFELEGARSWALRHDVPLDWLPSELEVRLVLTQPRTGQRFYFKARFPDYKELPPEWTLCDESWQSSNAKSLFPRPKEPATPASIFIGSGEGAVICAPFNRLAFSRHGGPHGDWSLAQWQTAAGGHIRATTVGDMLQALRLFMNRTEGRMQ